MKIFIRVLHPMYCNGEAYAAGAEFSVDPLDASAALDCGRAELVDPADAGGMQEAVTADNDEMMRALNTAARQDEATWVLRRRQRA